MQADRPTNRQTHRHIDRKTSQAKFTEQHRKDTDKTTLTAVQIILETRTNGNFFCFLNTAIIDSRLAPFVRNLLPFYTTTKSNSVAIHGEYVGNL